MSKRSERPWDQKATDLNVARLAQSVLEAPSVTLDGVKFFSDRFYLNQINGSYTEEGKIGITPNAECRCGSNQPPPLFPRERLVNSLDLKSAIIATFSVDVNWLADEFPQLVGPKSTVPTLILHGDKKVRQNKSPGPESNAPSSPLLPDSEEQQAFLRDFEPKEVDQTQEQHSTQLEKPTPILDSHMQAGSDTDSSSTDGSTLSLKTQDDRTTPDVILPAPKSSIREVTPLGMSIQQTSNNEVHNINKSYCDPFSGEHCRFTQVLPSWNRPSESRISHEGNTGTENSRESRRGVHHPKFMILFETSGDVVVVISTANLTRTRTIEGTWIQRFRPNRRLQRPGGATIGGKMTPMSNSPSNDFGPVLADFLGKLSDSAFDGETTVEAFLLQYMQLELKELPWAFHFEKAQVHLVPVIPGDWKCNPLKHKQPFVYGRQRVQQILEKETLIESKTDRLVAQPTSFGGNWKRCELADVVRSYLNLKETNQSYWDDDALLDRLDIVWPSRAYIQGLKGERSIKGKNFDNDKNDATGSSFVFFSSRAFNSCERACISRLGRFRESHPPQHPFAVVPHFKSFGRVITKKAVIRKHGFETKAQEYLAWFLLTSACLSHGAQGKRSKVAAEPLETVQYKNFELGVMFTSRIHNKHKRLYCFQPTSCNCHVMGSSRNQLIHLPIPYSLHPKPYLENEEDSTMQEAPFLHEIEDDTIGARNMLMIEPQPRKAKRRKGEKS